MLWANGEVLHASDIEAALLAPSSPKQEPVLQRRLGEGFKLDKLLLEVERQYLERALAEAKGNKTRAADLLGLRSHQVLGIACEELRALNEVPPGPLEMPLLLVRLGDSPAMSPRLSAPGGGGVSKSV